MATWPVMATWPEIINYYAVGFAMGVIIRWLVDR